MCSKILPVVDEDPEDIVYFLLLTMCSVGSSDISPESDLTRLVLIFYLCAGLCTLSIILGVYNAGSLKRRMRKMKEQQEEASQTTVQMLSVASVSGQQAHRKQPDEEGSGFVEQVKLTALK